MQEYHVAAKNKRLLFILPLLFPIGIGRTLSALTLRPTEQKNILIYHT